MGKSNKITAIISLALGIIVVIMGLSMLSPSASTSFSGSSSTYYSGSYDVRGASFGADFYTYMYDASDTIVEELNDISTAAEIITKNQQGIRNGIHSVMDATDSLNNTVSKTGGMIVIAIGLSILSRSVPLAADLFCGAKEEKKKEELPVEISTEI